MRELNEKEQKVCDLRKKKHTFKQIGIETDVTLERARQIYHKACNKLIAENDWADGLSTRACLVLKNAGIDNIDDCISALKKGILKPGKCKGYGLAVHNEVCRWLHISIKNDGCNCLIGSLDHYKYDPVYIDNIVESIKDAAQLSIDMMRCGYKQHKPIDYLNDLSLMGVRFKYCPLCGKKIDWDVIREKLK